MAPNNFSDYYKTISNTELLEILDHRENYQLLAVEAAKIEFEQRQLSEDEIMQARQTLISKHSGEEQQKERIKTIEKKIKASASIFVDTLNPIQSETPDTNKLIRIIAIVFLGLFCFQIINDFNMFSLMIKNIKDFDSSSFIYFLPFVVIPLAAITFLMKKTIGWMLLVFFIIYSAIGILWALSQNYSSEQEGILFNNLIPKPSPVVYISQVLFLAASLFIICKENVRKVFKINNQRLVATFFMSALVTIFLILKF
jgi:hypothetical protein